MQNFEVDLAGVKKVVEFELIEIIEKKDSYLSLLGIDWSYENYVIIDLNK
jgi:hypothetical protein